MYMNDKAKFENTARFWTETYARAEASRDEVRATGTATHRQTDTHACPQTDPPPHPNLTDLAGRWWRG